MKKLIALLVAVGICGLYWLGCTKQQPEPVAEEGMVVEEEVVPTTPPPPPPAPEAMEEKSDTETETETGNE